MHAIYDIKLGVTLATFLMLPLPKHICSGYKHFTLIDEKTTIPLSVRGAYIATLRHHIPNIWCLQYFPLIQKTAEPPHSSPLESFQPDYILLPRVRPGCHPGTGTTCQRIQALYTDESKRRQSSNLSNEGCLNSLERHHI